jgi:hypothetical protein
MLLLFIGRHTSCYLFFVNWASYAASSNERCCGCLGCLLHSNLATVTRTEWRGGASPVPRSRQNASGRDLGECVPSSMCVCAVQADGEADDSGLAMLFEQIRAAEVRAAGWGWQPRASHDTLRQQLVLAMPHATAPPHR